MPQPDGGGDAPACATEEELSRVPEVRPKIAAGAVAFFRQEQTRRLLEKLRRAGVRMEQRRAAPARENPLAGNTVVLTRTLASMGRKEAEEVVASLGGKPSGSVSRHPNYVVVRANPGSKYERHRAAGLIQRGNPGPRFAAAARRASPGLLLAAGAPRGGARGLFAARVILPEAGSATSPMRSQAFCARPAMTH